MTSLKTNGILHGEEETKNLLKVIDLIKKIIEVSFRDYF